MGETIFLLLSQRQVEMKLKKVAYCSSLSYFSLSFIHKAVGEVILPNIFFAKQLSFI
jgi:hypothetical protein